MPWKRLCWNKAAILLSFLRGGGQQYGLCAFDHTDMSTANAIYQLFINIISTSKSSSWHASVLYTEVYMPLEPPPPKEEFLFYLFIFYFSKWII
jgi:hypothetical protein